VDLIPVALVLLCDRVTTLHSPQYSIAYCRGPYCVLAPDAVERLRARGFKARRLQDGMPEWRLAGLPVAVGDD
jgi:hypothetical protein